jgi:hypothetical protein
MSAETPTTAAEIRQALTKVNQGSAEHKRLMAQLEAVSKADVAKKRANG